MNTLLLKREEWLKPLSFISNVLEKKLTQPILSQVLLRGEGNLLIFTGTDTELELHSIVTLPDERYNGVKLTLPGRKLLEICRTLPEDSDVEITENNFKITVLCNKSRFSLAALDPETFPLTPKQSSEITVTLPQSVLLTLVRKTAFTIPQQEVRRYLNGLLLEVKQGEVRVLATDGHRLAMSSAKFSDVNQDIAQVILPKKAVLELARLLTPEDGEVTLSFNNNSASIEGKDFLLITKLINGKFPNYTKIIPEQGKFTLTANVKELKQSLIRAGILSSELFRGVRFNIQPNRLVLNANTEQEEATEELAVEYSGPDMDLVFNYSYFIDILNIIDGENVILFLNESNGSLIIKEENNEKTLFVLMPIRQ